MSSSSSSSSTGVSTNSTLWLQGSCRRTAPLNGGTGWDERRGGVGHSSSSSSSVSLLHGVLLTLLLFILLLTEGVLIVTVEAPFGDIVMVVEGVMLSVFVSSFVESSKVQLGVVDFDGGGEVDLLPSARIRELIFFIDARPSEALSVARGVMCA